MHRRLQPKVHGFTYRIFLFWIDLDELELLDRKIPIFSNERSNLYSLRARDHFSPGGNTIRSNVVAWAAENGEARPPSRVRMLTLPRFLGYTFNPITIYVFYDEDHSPYSSVVEVGNTFGELKPYLVPMDRGAFRRRVAKEYYVSPFSELDLEFDFRIEIPGNLLRVWIDDCRGDEKVLVSALSGQARPLTTASLIACTLKYPFITLKVIGLIHWQAFMLWLKRIPFHLKESRTDLQRGVFRPHRSLCGKSAVQSEDPPS